MYLFLFGLCSIGTIVCPANYLPCDRSAHGHSTRFCLQPSRICDGDADCINDLDEENCPCKSSQFHCQSNGLCIDRKMQCDGVRDCVDYSDEIGCSKYIAFFNIMWPFVFHVHQQ